MRGRRCCSGRVDEEREEGGGKRVRKRERERKRGAVWLAIEPFGFLSFLRRRWRVDDDGVQVYIYGGSDYVV